MAGLRKANNMLKGECVPIAEAAHEMTTQLESTSGKAKANHGGAEWTIDVALPGVPRIVQ